jgi:methanethiol S-methyltransferase
MLFLAKFFNMETLIILWLLFFISHSALATSKAKAYFQDKLKDKLKHYRLIYNGISTFLLLLIFLKIFTTKQLFPFFDPTLLTCGLGFLIMMLGFLVMQETFKSYNLRAFIGLDVVGEESKGLNTEGVYHYLRHPLYFGIFIFLIGLVWTIPSEDMILSVIASIIYIVVGIEYEEKKLRATYGQAYDDYAKDKKKFIPFVY